MGLHIGYMLPSLRKGIMEVDEKSELIFRATINYKSDNLGQSPTLAELAHICELPRTTVHWHVNRLVADGRLKRLFHRNRLFYRDDDGNWV